MSKVSYGSRMGRIRTTRSEDGNKTAKPPEEVVRELKRDQARSSEEDYRERALAIYGLICSHCGREFESANRQLLTVHHKDGNHYNNPPDGSNWEPLCVYCHENIHSREMLADYMDGASGSGGKESSLVYGDEKAGGAFSSLGEKLQKALANKKNRS